MSTGRAVGSRLGYAAMPGPVREWVEAALGSPVVATADQLGGFSPGCATRLRCADGTRAFVKAVGADLNPYSPILFRREVQALTLLGSHPLWAELLDSYDDGDWVIVLLEDVEGNHPDLTDDATMARLISAVDDLSAEMNRRLPDPPRSSPPTDDDLPALFRPGPVELGLVFADWAKSMEHIDALPTDLAPGWLRERGAELRAEVSALASRPMRHVVHWDIRDDNLLVRPSGEVVFLDWGAFGVGPDWLDPLLARLERVHLPWFDRSLAASPALVAAGDEVVTSWLVGMGAHLAYRAHVSVDVNLPTLAAFRRQESARFLEAARRRLGA